MKKSPLLSFMLMALLTTSWVQAATFRVNDTATFPTESVLQMRWRDASPRAGMSPFVDGRTQVMIRLDLTPWVGRRGKIYMGLPSQSIGSVQVQWQSLGHLLPGHLVSGERTLVYEGAVDAPALQDTLNVLVSADGRHFENPQRLEFYFEIDLDE